MAGTVADRFAESLAAGDIAGSYFLPRDCRFVEKDDFRLVQQPTRDLKPALHAPGEFPDRPVASVTKIDELKRDTRLPYVTGNSVENIVQLHFVLRGEVLVERGILKNDSKQVRCTASGSVAGLCHR